MELSDIINLIHYKKYQFEIELKGRAALRRPFSEILDHYPNLENYFEHIAELHHTDELTISLFSKNGSSIKRRGKFLVQIPGVAKRNNTVAKSNEGVAGCNEHVANGNEDAPCPLHGVQNYHQSQQMLSNTMDTHAQILQVRLEHALDKVSDLDRRNKDLERKNDELYSENLKLVRESSIHKDKLDLEYQKKELELSSEKQEGLSGIVDKFSSMPPEAYQLIAGFFPNHPMAKGIAMSGTAEPAQLPPVSKRHADGDTNIVLDMLHSLLLQQTPENVGMISMIAQALVRKPEEMARIYKQFYPNNF